MRARLLWRQVRTDRLRFLFIVAVAAGFIYIAYASLMSGAGVALASTRLPNSRRFIDSFLVLTYLSGIALQIVMGRGLHALFSDAALRNYPFSAWQRRLIRESVWILDPVWLSLTLLLLGAAVGLCIIGAFRPWFVLSAAALLLVCTRLTSSVLLAFIESMLCSVSGTSLLAAIAMLILSAISLASIYHVPLIASIAGIGALPPGAAAALLGASQVKTAVVPLLVLIAWIGVLLLLLPLFENIAFRPAAADGARPTWTSRLILARSGQSQWTLAIKALAYNLRCDRMRLSLVVAAPVLIFYAVWMAGKQGIESGPFCLMGAFFAVGFAGTRSILLNQFGYDGPALARYSLLPESFDASLRCGSLVSLFLSFAVTLPALVLVSLLDAVYLTQRFAAILVLCALAGSFFFNGVGLFVSVLAPRRVEFRRLLGNDMSFTGNVAIYGGLLLSFGVPLWLSTTIRFQEVLRAAPLFLGIAMMCAAWYIWALRAAGKMARLRRERLLESLSI